MISGYLMLESIASIIVDTNEFRKNAELVGMNGLRRCGKHSSGPL
nr:hypothetical protein [uncultured Albidiferax sp.]